MARLPRLVVPNQPHYIIQSGIDRLVVFRDTDDHTVFLQWLREAARQFKIALHAYALLPDRLHLLATPSDSTGLARMMQWVGRQYVPYFNGKYQRAGTLWQGRYRAAVLDAEQYFLLCSCHIELLPVQLGLVSSPAEYPWSSYGHHVGYKPDPVITDHPLYWALGNTPFQREAGYKALFDQNLPPQQGQLLDQAAHSGWPLGSDVFKKILARQSNRRVTPGKKGRPVKTPSMRITN